MNVPINVSRESSNRLKLQNATNYCNNAMMTEYDIITTKFMKNFN
jgi:hypothetical protein